MALDKNKIKTYYNALQFAHALDYAKAEDKDRYVENLHGDEDPMQGLFQAITLQDGQGVYLFSGQRGSGKSTELKRLKYQLQSHGHYKVYYLDMTEWLNYTRPLELGSFLVAVLAAWVEQAEIETEDETSTEKPTLAQRFRQFLTDTKIKVDHIEFKANLGIAKAGLQLSLHSDDTVLKDIENAVKQGRSSFVAQAKRFCEELASSLCQNGEKCVLLIDSLEKISGPSHDPEAVLGSVLDLFSRHSEALKLPLVHVVYSIAPFVLEQNCNLAAVLGCAMTVQLPSVHVFQRESMHPDWGVGCMLAILEKRCPGWQAFFDETEVSALACDSGGDLRDFMRALQHALLWISDNNPRADENTFNKARTQIHPTLVIPIEDIEWMQRIDKTHRPEINGRKGALLLERYLNTKHILAYLNGETWYGLHPLIRDFVLKATQPKE